MVFSSQGFVHQPIGSDFNPLDSLKDFFWKHLSGYDDLVKDALDHILCGHIFRFGLIGGMMRWRRTSRPTDLTSLESHSPTVDEGMLLAAGKEDRGAGAAPY
jgi:hypothetical protein